MKKPTLCIIGLGYVGLPLAYAFAKHGYTVHGFDVSESRISELKQGRDRTNELTEEELQSVTIDYGTDPAIIGESDIAIFAIPTPVDEANKPDLALVESATRMAGKYLKKGMILVYESTVYPGVTEDICGPILERESGLRCGTDFTLGYSPERINPGDKLHTVESIVKVVAGQDAATLAALTELYGSIVSAGIHQAPSIKVAEMAKAIENAQRDINIAYMNEVAMLCGKIGIRTNDVLAAAATKWNFLPFQPGLVGGHCIGVDPYYLVEKAAQLGMETRIIAAGRSVNDGMSGFIASHVRAELGGDLGGKCILVLGLTFKENVPDTRNSKVRDVMRELSAGGAVVHAHDPFYSADDIQNMGLAAGSLEHGPYDAVLLLVPHKQYVSLPENVFWKALKSHGLFYDLKSVVSRTSCEEAGHTYRSL